MQDKAMNTTQFCEEIGIKPARLSHITNERNKLSADVIAKIINRFDDINAGWVLTGKGPMKLVPDSPEKNIDRKKPDLFNAQRFDDNHSKYNTAVSNKKSAENDANVHVTPKNPTNTPANEVIRKVNHTLFENRRGEIVIQDDSNKSPEKEVIIYKERPVKTINKILIFFSDQTYETFIPEKTDSKQ